MLARQRRANRRLRRIQPLSLLSALRGLSPYTNMFVFQTVLPVNVGTESMCYVYAVRGGLLSRPF